jgi:fructoselysine 6-kinase
MQTMSLNNLKVVCFSSICADYYPQQGLVKPGGNSLNFAIHAKRFGAKKVSIAGFIGTDPNADMILNTLIREQINTKYLTQIRGATARNKIYNTPEGERYSNQGDWENGVKNSGVFSDEAWAYILDHDIIAIPYLDKSLDEFLKRRSKEHFITIDFLHFDDPGVIRQYLSLVDIAFISLSPEKVTELSKLAKNTDSLMVTMLGAFGSKAFLRDKEYFQPAFEIKKVTDTTGCGDSYQAAFVCS